MASTVRPGRPPMPLRRPYVGSFASRPQDPRHWRRPTAQQPQLCKRARTPPSTPHESAPAQVRGLQFQAEPFGRAATNADCRLGTDPGMRLFTVCGRVRAWHAVAQSSRRQVPPPTPTVPVPALPRNRRNAAGRFPGPSRHESAGAALRFSVLHAMLLLADQESERGRKTCERRVWRWRAAAGGMGIARTW